MTIVETVTRLRVVAPNPGRVTTTFSYDTTEPYTVTIHFACDDCVCDNRWYFGRDLLAAGLDHPAGIGDVRILPVGQTVGIVFNNGTEMALVEAPRHVLTRFLRDIRLTVPDGTEHEWLDVDGLIAEAFGEADLW